jgi:hypothetical protein
MKRGLNQENSLPDPEFGGESSESARAIHYVVQKDTLMTYVSALTAQADPGIVSGSTTERKQMSTKTSFKRIALVAVTALGAGVLSVAPASAALSTTVAVVTNTSGTVYGTVGTAATAQLQLATTTAEAAGTAGDSFTLVPTIASQPVGGGLTVGAPASGTVGLTSPAVTGNMAATATVNKWTSTVSAGIQTLAFSTGTIPAQAAADVSTLSLTATVAGTYTVTVTPTGTLASPNTKTPVTVTFNIAGLAYSLGDGAAVSPAIAGNGIAGPANTVTVNATTNGANNRALVTVSGAGATINSNAGAAVAAGVTSTIVAAGTNAAIIINTPTVGTVTVSQFYESGNGTGIYAATASKTATITVGAAAVNGTLSVANSKSIMDATIGADNEAWSTITADETGSFSANDATASNNPSLEVAVIKVTLNDTLNNPMPNATTVSAKVSGPGILAIGANTTQPSAAVGRDVSIATAAGNGVAFVSVYRDGTAGVSTITISVGTTVVATETVTFYGAVASLKATVKKNVASGTTATGALDVIAYDAANVVVPSVGITVTSGTTATIANFTETTSTASEAKAGTAVVDVTAVASKFGAVVLTIKDTATGLVSTTATVNVGSAIVSTLTAAFDKTSYTPGELVTLTLTGKDSNGAAVGDAASEASSFTITTNAVTSTALTTDAAFVLGVQKITFYAPAFSGPLLASIKLTASKTIWVDTIEGTTVTATSAVASSTDISALTTLVNSLIAKINALNKLVIKIQKKVKA